MQVIKERELQGAMNSLNELLNRPAAGMSIAEATILGTRANTVLGILTGRLQIDDVQIRLATVNENGERNG